MACLSEVSAIASAPQGFSWTSLARQLDSWWQRPVLRGHERDIALLNDRELRDLGIQRGWVVPHDRSELEILCTQRGIA
ncbi:hypothetical protein [Bosea vaviloviae]|uniref:hypothetical protein n=1 Tax=Bosea vaviloviae TaxID=1526658 RepID=UPI0011DFC98B|nr:hypothetical protein [Bosea vaviloviae]